MSEDRQRPGDPQSEPEVPLFEHNLVPHDHEEISSVSAESVSGMESVADVNEEASDEQEPGGTTIRFGVANNHQPEANDDLSSVLGLKLRPAANPEALGTIKHYDILRIIGHGGMGTVLLAFDPQLHRRVAIKAMKPQFIASDRARKRFYREARSAASINHPNVVTIHAIDEDQRVPFLVMEYVPGLSLFERIQHDAPLEIADVVRIASQIASGIAAAHRHGVIHRDIKPGNIMLEDKIERVKITDFGLAILAMEQSDLTSMGDLVGTPAYMSPEQVDGYEVGAASDLFSLGCVVYTMINGSSPFRAPGSLATARRVVEYQPEPLIKIQPNVPVALSDLVQELLAKDPKDRPASAEVVAEQLTAMMANENQRVNGSRIYPRVNNPRRISLLAGTGIAVLLLLVTFNYQNWKSWLTSPAAGPEVVAGPPAVKAVSLLKDKMLTIGKENAECTSITEALSFAEPGTTLLIREGQYDEPITMDGTDGRLQNVHIKGEGNVVVRNSYGESTFLLRNTPHLRISNLTIEARTQQHCIQSTGLCPGLVVESCALRCPPESNLAVLFCSATSGTKEEPVVLQNLQIVGGGVGVVINDSDSELSQWLVVQCCTISAASRERGIPIVVQSKIANVVIRRNILRNAMAGLSLSFPLPLLVSSLSIENNSLHNMQFMCFLNSSDDKQDVHIRENLIVDVDTVFSALVPLKNHDYWFERNGWIPGPGTDHIAAQEHAELLETKDILSYDPDNPDYLRPQPNLPRKFPGRFDSSLTDICASE